MLQREGSGTLINTSDDEIARHNGNRIYGCTRRHPKKFQIALGIISLIKSNNGRLYFDSLSADRLTLTKTHCAAIWIYTLAGIWDIHQKGRPGRLRSYRER
jgi:hypothetical protein